MTYLPDLHSYLHQSSLLIQAYPTTRITTKYALPRRNRTPKPSDATKEKREPAATLTLKTYHADSGICLKYQTDKAQEVGRLLTGLGRLARGEIVDMPSVSVGGQGNGEDKMEVDAETVEAVKVESVKVEAAQHGGSGGGKKKKKGGKR